MQIRLLPLLLMIDHAGRNTPEGDEFVGGDWALVVDRLAQRIYDAADQGVAHGDAHDASGPLHFVAFFDLGVFAEQHDADLVFFQVHGDAGHAVREGEQLAGHDFVESIDAGNAIAQRNDRAGFVDLDLRLVVLDLLAD